MARNLQAKHTLCRRTGEKLCGLTKCPAGRRPFPKGVHGPTARTRLTGYGIQLQEKQKAKFIYGVLERQFSTYVSKAIASRGNTSEILLRSLETRLDNVVYRLGFAATRWQARQFVSHGHFMLNDKKVTIPSIQVRPGDNITIRPQSAKNKIFLDVHDRLRNELPPWITLDTATLTARVIGTPSIDDAKPLFDTKAIVEFYSR